MDRPRLTFLGARARKAAAENGELLDDYIGDSTVAAEPIALVAALEAAARV